MSQISLNLIDTHAHINLMVKEKFDISLTTHEIEAAHAIVQQAKAYGVSTIINVGTSVIESKNCIALAKAYAPIYAAIGIHPNDCSENWKTDIATLSPLISPENKVIAIGEIGLDKHYPDYNIQRQTDAFKMQIELALEKQLPILIHSRDATQETLNVVDMYTKEKLQGIIHCFSDAIDIAREYINRGFFLGIGGTITYPKNQYLRDVITGVGVEHLVLETDAPYLAPQAFRGKKNHPQHIYTIAQYISQLTQQDIIHIAQKTTENVTTLFKNNF